MKNLIYYTLCLSILLSCSDKEMIIEELKIDTSKGNYTYKDSINRLNQRIFILQNFCYCGQDEIIIDNLVCSLIEDKTYEYSFIFYKESKVTNIDHLTNFPRDLDRYSRNDKLLGVSYKPDLGGEIQVWERYNSPIGRVDKAFLCKGDSVKYIQDSKFLK